MEIRAFVKLKVHNLHFFLSLTKTWIDLTS